MDSSQSVPNSATPTPASAAAPGPPPPPAPPQPAPQFTAALARLHTFHATARAANGPIPAERCENHGLWQYHIYDFEGRDAELAEIHTLLTTHGAAIITGGAGIGKTALAWRYAERAGEAVWPSPIKYGHIMFLRGGSICDLATQFIAMAAQFCGMGQDVAEKLPLREVVAAVWCFLVAHGREAPVLVVFDDVAAFGALSAFLPADVNTLISSANPAAAVPVSVPASGGADTAATTPSVHVLITTRASASALKLEMRTAGNDRGEARLRNPLFVPTLSLDVAHPTAIEVPGTSDTMRQVYLERFIREHPLSARFHTVLSRVTVVEMESGIRNVYWYERVRRALDAHLTAGHFVGEPPATVLIAAMVEAVIEQMHVYVKPPSLERAVQLLHLSAYLSPAGPLTYSLLRGGMTGLYEDHLTTPAYHLTEYGLWGGREDAWHMPRMVAEVLRSGHVRVPSQPEPGRAAAIGQLQAANAILSAASRAPRYYGALPHGEHAALYVTFTDERRAKAVERAMREAMDFLKRELPAEAVEGYLASLEKRMAAGLKEAYAAMLNERTAAAERDAAANMAALQARGAPREGEGGDKEIEGLPF